MIAYFSGTGNSRYVAGQLAELLGEKNVFIPAVKAEAVTFEGESLGFVVPVYAWGIPPIVLEWIKRLSSEFRDAVRRKGGYVWCALTCGDETGMAPEMMRDALSKIGLTVSGMWSVQMPNVYVLLPGFNVDPDDVEQSKLLAARDTVKKVAEGVRRRVVNNDVVYGPMPRLKTRMVYPLFVRWGIFTRRWHWTEECVGCGKCVKACPVHNIKMKNGRPSWGPDCTSCLGCYHICPAHAVAYGKITDNKGQYYLQ